jgi:hypothetical protein
MTFARGGVEIAVAHDNRHRRAFLHARSATVDGGADLRRVVAWRDIHRCNWTRPVQSLTDGDGVHEKAREGELAGDSSDSRYCRSGNAGRPEGTGRLTSTPRVVSLPEPVLRDPLVADRAEIAALIAPLPRRHERDHGGHNAESDDDPYGVHE